jgi:hypothetical protein
MGVRTTVPSSCRRNSLSPGDQSDDEESGHLEAQETGAAFLCTNEAPQAWLQHLGRSSNGHPSPKRPFYGITPKDPRSDGVAPALYLARE